MLCDAFLFFFTVDLVLSIPCFAPAHEFSVRQTSSASETNLVFLWRVEGSPNGVPWINIFDTGHIGEQSHMRDYWEVRPAQQREHFYDPQIGIRPSKSRPFPLRIQRIPGRDAYLGRQFGLG